MRKCRAQTYADLARAGVWEFAPSLARLQDAGLDEIDLQLLMRLGHVDCSAPSRVPATSCLSTNAERRKFSAATCFALTETGIGLCELLANRGTAPEEQPLTPRFEQPTRELWLAECLIKRFRQPAIAQETILASFAKQGWPPTLEDPLPRVPGQEPKRRLHDAVNNLNRNQRKRLLHFFVTFNGRRVGWRIEAHLPG